MPTKNLILNLAKLVIATAWADGQVKASEVNVLKDLVYSWGDLGEEEWTALEAYIEAPVREGERERLLQDVLDSIATASDKRLVVDTVRRLVEADGEVSQEEERVLEEIRNAVESRSTGLGSFLSALVGGAVSKRSQADRDSPAREDRLEDFIRNKIYFQLVTELEHSEVEIDLPEEETRKLCLVAGLLAQVAWTDEEIDAGEKSKVREVLREEWDLSRAAAELVCEVSVDRMVRGLDHFRLTREYFELTDFAERRQLLFRLFEVANAVGNTSFEEIENIRRIARSLKLPHRDFIAAKLSVSTEDRSGL